MSCEINEELFYADFGCNIMGFSLHRCKWRIFCVGEVVIFGSLGAVMLNLELLFGNLVIFHCGVAG